MRMGMTASGGRPSRANMTLPLPIFFGVLNRQEREAP